MVSNSQHPNHDQRRFTATKNTVANDGYDRRSQSVGKFHPSGSGSHNTTTGAMSFQQDVQAQLRREKEKNGRSYSAMRTPLPTNHKIPTFPTMPPRQVPTGPDPNRLRSIFKETHDDPESVARAILDLRERREQQQATGAVAAGSSHHQHSSNNRPTNNKSPKKKKSSERSDEEPAMSRRSASTSRLPMMIPNQQQQQQQTAVGIDRSATRQRTTTTNNLQGTHQDKLTKELQYTEQRIDGLMQEIDDMKFFEELDQAESPPTLRSQSVPKPRPLSPSRTPTRLQASGPQQQQQQQRQNSQYGDVLKTPRGDMIPSLIQAIPSSHLPPPPPPPPMVVYASTKKSKPEPLSPLLSPRQISKLDRVALELETQTLCRKVDVLRREKQTLESQINMYEVTRLDQEQKGGQIHQLESALTDVRAALRSAQNDLMAVREHTVAEYEQRLSDNLLKLHSTQAAVDKMRTERDSVQKQCLRYQTELEEIKTKGQSEHNNQLCILEAQLQEVTELAEELQKEVQEKEHELLDLQEKCSKQIVAMETEFRETTRELRKQLTNREGEIKKLSNDLLEKEKCLIDKTSACDRAYEQLSSEKSKVETEQIKIENLLQRIEELNQQVSQYIKSNADQTNLISEMTKGLEAVHVEYKQKLQVQKDSYESKEKRRLNEMVLAHRNESMDYEKRIKALQEKLTFATDRHHQEIQQKDVDCNTKLASLRTDLRRDIETEYKQQLHVVEERLASVQQEYELTEKERQRLRVVAESAPYEQQSLRDKLQNECDYQISIRQREIERLQDTAEQLRRQLSEKDIQVQEYLDQNNTLKEQYQQEKNTSQKMEGKLQANMSQREKEFEEFIISMESRIDELKFQLETTQMAKDEDTIQNESQLASIRSMYEKSRMELNDEKKRNERIKELEIVYGRVKGELIEEKKRGDKVESDMRVQISELMGTIQKKNTVLADLEVECRRQHDEHIFIQKQSEEKTRTLQNQLDDMQRALDRERLKYDEKDKEVFGYMEREKTMEYRLSDLQEKCTELQNRLLMERNRNETEEAEMRGEISMLQIKLRSDSAQRHMQQQSREEKQRNDDKLEVIKNELRLLRIDYEKNKELLELEQVEVQRTNEQMQTLQLKYETLLVTKKQENDSVRALQQQQALNDSKSVHYLEDLLTTERLRNEEMQRDLEQYRNRMELLESEMQDARDDSNTSRDELENLRIKLLTANEDVRNKQKELEKLRQLTTNQSEQILELEKRISNMAENMQTMKNYCDEVDVDLEQLNKKHKADRNRSESTEAKLRDEISALEEKIRTLDTSTSYFEEDSHEILDNEKSFFSEPICNTAEREVMYPKATSTSSPTSINHECVEKLKRELSNTKKQIEEEKLTLKLRTDVYETERNNQEEKLREKNIMIQDLQSQLSVMANELQSLQSKINDGVGDSDSSSDTRMSMRQQQRFEPSTVVSALNEKLSRMEGKLLASESILAVKQEEITILQQKVQDTIHNSSSSTKELQCEVEDLRQKLFTITDQLTREKCEHEATDKFLNKLRKQHQHDLDEKSMKILQLEEKIQKALMREKSLTACTDKLDSTYQKAQSDFLAEIEYLKSTESNLREEISSLQRKYQSTESDLRSARKEGGELESEMRKLKENSNIAVKKLNEEISSLTKSIDRKQNELQMQEQTIAAQTEEINGQKNLISVLKDEVSMEHENNENFQVNLRVQISMLEGKVRALESSLKEKRNTLEKVESKLKRTEEDSILLQNELQGKIKTQEKELEKITKQLSVEKENMRKLGNECKTERSRLEVELKETLEVVKDTELSLTNSMQQEKSAREHVKKLEQSINELNVSKALLETEIDSLKVTIKTRDEQLEQERKELDHCLDELDQAQRSLKSSNKKLEELSTLKSKVINLTAQLCDVQKLKDEKESQLKDIQDMYTTGRALLSKNENDIELNIKIREGLETKVKEQEHLLLLKSSEIESLTSKIEKLEPEIEIKDQQLLRLPKLLNQLKDASQDREDLQTQLARIEADQRRKEKFIAQLHSERADEERELTEKFEKLKASNLDLSEQLRFAESDTEVKVARLTRQVEELDTECNEQKSIIEDLKQKLRKAEGVIASQKLQLNSISDEFAMDLQVKLEALTRAKATLEYKIRELEDDRDDREQQIKLSSEKSSNQILELQMKVEELNVSKTSLTQRLQRTDSELEDKEEKLTAFTRKNNTEIAELRRILSEHEADKEMLQNKVDETKMELSALLAESKSQDENRKIEFQTRLDAESKEKRSLQSKIRDIESEVQRKEKQIKDIVDRYAKEIATLENQLDDESRAKSSLQRKLESMNALGSSPSEYDGADIRDRHVVLEKSLESERTKVLYAEDERKRLQEQLDEQRKSNTALKVELDELKKSSQQKTHVPSRDNYLLDKVNQLQKLADEEQNRAKDALSGRKDAEDLIAAQQDTITALKKEIDFLREKNSSSHNASTAVWELTSKVKSLEKSVEVERALIREADITREQLERNLSDVQKSKEALSREIEDLKASLRSESSSQSRILQESITTLRRSVDSERNKLADADKKILDLQQKLNDKENYIATLRDNQSSPVEPSTSALTIKIVELESVVAIERSQAQEHEKIRKELETMLETEAKEKAQLQEDVEKLRKSVMWAPHAASETRALKKQLSILESAVGKEQTSPNRHNASELERKLTETEKYKDELEQRLEKVNAERTEVINALEEVINEVQNREDEIEALASILRKRDEELEHAKLIAAKAIASAQEIKSRYKGNKGQGRQSELNSQVEELQSNVEFLKHKTENLQGKSSRLERELNEKNQEITDLKSALRKQTTGKAELSRSPDSSSKDKFGFLPLKDDFPTFDCTFSKSPSDESGSGANDINDSMSTHSAELHSPNSWLHEFDSQDTEDTNSIAAAQTEPSTAVSKRSVERDALRKYVRKRYLKSKTSNNTN